MKILKSIFILLMFLTNLSLAAEVNKTPHLIINELQQQLYKIGETSGGLKNFEVAEINAVNELKLVETDTGLVERNKSGATPLISASILGYSRVVEELLKSRVVRESINAEDEKGGTAWLYSNMAMRQAMWVCNPGILQNIFVAIPMFITQPFYLESKPNPYRRVRTLLENSNAKKDSAQQFWGRLCVQQTTETKAKVDHSTDILDFILPEGERQLKNYLEELKNKK